MEQKVLKVRSSRNAAQGPPFACSAKIPSTYSYYQTLHFLPHHQDQDKVFCKYSTSHKSCRCTYFLNSPCLFPRRKGKHCFNIQCSEKTKDRKNGNLEKKKILFCFTSPKQSLCTSAQKSKHNDITQTPMPYSNQQGIQGILKFQREEEEHTFRICNGCVKICGVLVLLLI